MGCNSLPRFYGWVLVVTALFCSENKLEYPLGFF